jgi:DNA-binding FadR family transcriptional regulator
MFDWTTNDAVHLERNLREDRRNRDALQKGYQYEPERPGMILQARRALAAIMVTLAARVAPPAVAVQPDQTVGAGA